MAASPSPRPSALLIANARPIDVTAGRRGEASDVTVERGLVIDVRPASRRGGASPSTLDAGGRWLIRSMVDAHVHLLGTGERESGWPASDALARYRDAGVTVVRELTPGGRPPVDPIDGTRVLSPASRATDMRPGQWHKAYSLPADGLQSSIREARRHGGLVAAHLAPNTAMSLVSPDALLPDSVEHVYTLVDYDTVTDAERDSAGVDQRDRGLATWALASARRHPGLLSLVSRLGRERAFVVPTLAVMRGMLPQGRRAAASRALPDRATEAWLERSDELGWSEPLDAARVRLRRAALAGLARLTRDLSRAGARIVAGTDFGEPFILPGEGIHAELTALRSAGLGPADVLRAAVDHPRQMMGEPTGIGPGSPAELLLLERDPLTDPAALRQPWAVIAGESVFRPASA